MLRPYVFTFCACTALTIDFASAASLSLDAAIRDQLEHAPQIQAQKTAVDLARGDRWRRFLIKEPQLQYGNTDDNTSQTLGVSFTTSFPGRSLAFTELDHAKLQGEQAEHLAKKQELARLTAQAYIDCAVSKTLLEMQTRAAQDLEALHRSISVLYESGHGIQAEKIGTELQWRQAEADLAQTHDKAVNDCHRFNKLMGYDHADLDPEALPEDLAPETLADLGDVPSEEAKSEAAIHIAQANSHLSWWAQAPDLNWSIARNHYVYLPGSPNGKEWTTTYMVGITLPLFLPFSEAVEAKRQKAQATMDRASAEIQLIQAHSDHEQASHDFARSRKRLQELHSRDLPLAEALVQSTFAAYKAGKMGFAELTLSRKTMMDLRAQELQLRASLLNARLRCLQSCDR